MSTAATAAGALPASAAGRRLRAGAAALVALLAVTVSVVLVNILATRFPNRFDATATGEHQLSPRTLKLLETLKNPYRIVIAGDLAGIDRRARERVTDVLDQFRRAGPHVSLTTIESGSASGQADFDALVADLAAQERATLEAQVRVIDGARAAAGALADFLDQTLSPGLDKVRIAAADPASGGDDKAGEFFNNLGAAARIGAQDLRAAGAACDEPLRATLRNTPVPATDKAAAIIRQPLAPLVQQLLALARQLQKVADAPTFPGAARDALVPLIRSISDHRARAALAMESLDRLERPGIRRVADVIAKGNAALVIGPPAVGLTAIDFAALFPSSQWLDAAGLARADIGRRAEELVSSAIGALERPVKPIVVIVHAEAVAFFDKQHRFHRIMDRLAMRGIDTLEWACAVDDQPPDLQRVNPDGKRPVVYASLAPNSAAPTGPQGEKAGVDRAKRLGQVLEQLASEGKPLLVSMNPHVLAATGQGDPTVSVLTAFGLAADTGHALMREQVSARGRAALANITAQAPGGQHPLAAALKGLPLYLEWPIPLSHAKDATDASITDLYSASDDGTVWAESQWTGVWYARGNPQLIAEAPAYDKARDLKQPSWLLAAAAERRAPAGAPTRVQRLVAVGSNTWFIDDRAELTRIDGRIAEATPGNHELFESSVYWLSGMDDLIAASPGARAVPLVSPISDGQLKLLRALVIGAIPLLVLAAGILFRWLRG